MSGHPHPPRPQILVCWECGRRLYGNSHRVVYCADPQCKGHPAHKRCCQGYDVSRATVGG